MVPLDDDPVGARRLIKRYSNRKLYDSRESRYVTLLEIAEFIRSGEDVQVIDNATKEDKTDVTLALIISEELRARPKGIPLSALKDVIREQGARLLNQLRDGPIGKLMPRDDLEEGAVAGDATEAVARGLWATLEQWQQAVDERIRTLAPSSSSLGRVEQQLSAVMIRLESLEERLRRLEPRVPVGRPIDASRE